VGDDGGDRKDIRQRAEVVADGHQVEHPDRSILAAEGEQADVAAPGIEPVAFAIAVGFEV